MIQALAKGFNDGGPFMWVILIVFCVACAVVLERIVFYFLVCKPNGASLVSEAVKALNAEKAEDAKRAVTRRKAPMNMLLSAAVQSYSEGLSYDDIQESVDETAIKEMPRMTQRLNYLSLFANIGTLLGLLGTIVGLQDMFRSLAAVEAEKKAAMLAAGISQAMNATAFGLIVAIPCMVMYTTLYNKQQHITKDLDEAVVRFLNYLKKKKAA
jgi:biopolymer transport protein ExbB/TolQ